VNVRGLRLVPVGDELASYFGEGSERGALVVEAPDWASALRAGDVLLRVNGHAVRTGTNLENILLDLDRSRATTVELLRGGERRSVTIPANR
jgi:S1-C subfamily serine protease